MALALRNHTKKWLFREAINSTCCFGDSFLRLQIVHSETQGGKSPHILAGSFASPNDRLTPSKEQPYKSPEWSLKQGPLLLGCSFYFFGAE